MCLVHSLFFKVKKKIIQGYDFSSEFSFDHIKVFHSFLNTMYYSFAFSLRLCVFVCMSMCMCVYVCLKLICIVVRIYNPRGFCLEQLSFYFVPIFINVQCMLVEKSCLQCIKFSVYLLNKCLK